MLDEFIFENHLGQRFEGLSNQVYLNYTDLRDYTWKYDVLNDKISRFYRSITKRKIPLVVCCKTADDAVTIKNRLHELAESDIEAMTPGKIYSGDYYTQGFITGCSRSDYLINKRFCKLDLTFTSNDPFWYREEFYRFLPIESLVIGEGYDFPFDYKYDYETKTKTSQNIVCNSLRGNAFKLVIYGPVSNPSVKIGEHEYLINGTIGSSETLVIDSLAKTITLMSQTGQKLNWFDRRGRDDYIFEPIPSGQSVISWSGAFGFDLTVIEKRSEPPWM